MIIRCGLVLLFLSCVKTTTNNIHENALVARNDVDRIFSYSFWPSMHNAAKMIKLRKRELQNKVNIDEGGDVLGSKTASPPKTVTTPLPPNDPPKSKPTDTVKPDSAPDNSNISNSLNGTANGGKPSILAAGEAVVNGNTTINGNASNSANATNSNETTTAVLPMVSEENAKHNETIAKSNVMDLKNPGVLTRALIVFGGFALMAVAYFIFYKRKGKSNETSSTHGINDANQFRYGILQSDDRRDNLELSRVPLTMESDEDEDDDLEIFDLEQKKKSLSYVNLQTNDEDVVFSNSGNERGNDRDNLLLDIEDASTDALINWSNNGNKSIL